MQSKYEEAVLVFIAECMCISGMAMNKLNAVKLMVDRANASFRGIPATPERVAEVKSIILSVA